MSNNLSMDVFLFEYVTAGGDVPGGIVVEGLGMFQSLYKGFRKIPVRVNSFVKSEYLPAFSFPVSAESECNSDDIESKVEEFAEKSEFSLVIAPEDENLLFNLTKIAEKRSENLGSESKGIAITSDKWETYKALKNKVRVPETSLNLLDPPFLLKPRISCGGEGIEIVKDVESEEDVLKLENLLGKSYFAQEFVSGDNLSVSLMVGSDINLLSFNGQLIQNFEYGGAEVPVKNKMDKKDLKRVFEEAVEAVACIKGLHGYVGVDVVLAEDPFIIEINARLTTPSILFEKVYGFNLSDLILKNHLGSIDWSEIERVVMSRIESGESLILEKVRDGVEIGSVEKAGKKLPVGKLEKIIGYKGYAMVCYPV